MNIGRGPRPDRAGGEGWALSPDSRRPLPELIENKLRQLIESGEFSTDERLPTEPELAAKMQVARSSLRTALQRLQLHGVVEVVRGRGWYVRSTDRSDAGEKFPALAVDRRFSDRDLLEVRIALEAAAVSLAAARATPGELDDIAKASAAHEAASSTDEDELLRTDETFHATVVRASHNELLDQLYQTLVPHLRTHRRKSYTSREVHVRSANDHNQVVMFLLREDEVGARTAMTTHLLGLYRDLARSAGPAGATLTTYVGVQDEPMWDKEN